MPWNSRATAVMPDSRLHDPEVDKSQDTKRVHKTSSAYVVRLAMLREVQKLSLPDQGSSQCPPKNTAVFEQSDQAKAKWCWPSSMPKTRPPRCQPVLTQDQC